MRPRPFLLLLAGFALALMAAGEADADESLHFFIKEDNETLSVEGKEPDEPAAQKRIEAEYNEISGIRMGRDPVEVGTWTTSPMEFGLNITIENMSLWWEEIDEGYNNQCEWTFYIYHNGQEISQNAVECQSDGEELSRDTYNIGTSIELNSNDTFAIEIWYEGWEDVDLYYDNLTYDSGSGVVCENSCLPLPEAIIESVSLHQAEKGTLVEFNGSGTTVYGQVSNYLWESSIDGDLSTASLFNTTNLSLGNHIISFSVGNTAGYRSEKITTFIWIYTIPVAIAGDDVSTTPNVPIQFNGQGTDVDGTIAKYEWDFDGNGVYDWSSTENGLTTYIYNNKGTYTVMLRVTDNDGFTDTDTVVITVTEKIIQIDDEGNVTVTDAGEDEEGIPAPSLAAAVAAVAVTALRRPKKPNPPGTAPPMHARSPSTLLREMPRAAWGVLSVGLLLALLTAVLHSSMDEPSTYDIGGEALAVTVSGGYAYIAAGSNGLVVVDVSDPSNPTYAWNYSDTEVDDVVLYDNSIYALTQSGSQSFITELSMNGQFLDESGRGIVTDFKLSDEYMYVITPNRMYTLEGRLTGVVGDFSNIPSESGDGSALRKMVMSDDYVYVATDSNYHYVDGEYLPYSGGLLIVDVNDPTNPSLEGSYHYDVNDINQNGLGNAHDIAISGNHAYLAHDEDGLVIVDIRNPRNPTYAGRYNTPSPASSVAVSDGTFPFQKHYVLVATEDDGLIVVDAGNPSDPTYVGGYNTTGIPTDVAESGGTLPFQKRYAYVTTDSGELVVYELPSSRWGTPFIILLLTGIVVAVIALRRPRKP